MAIEKHWIWDCYPLAVNAWGNRHEATDTLPGHEAVMFSQMLNFIRKLDGSLNRLVQRQHKAYRPSERDLDIVRCFIPNGDPFNPCWSKVKTMLVAHGHDRRLLTTLDARTLLRLLGKRKKLSSSRALHICVQRLIASIETWLEKIYEHQCVLIVGEPESEELRNAHAYYEHAKKAVGLVGRDIPRMLLKYGMDDKPLKALLTSIKGEHREDAGRQWSVAKPILEKLELTLREIEENCPIPEPPKDMLNYSDRPPEDEASKKWGVYQLKKLHLEVERLSTELNTLEHSESDEPELQTEREFILQLIRNVGKSAKAARWKMEDMEVLGPDKQDVLNQLDESTKYIADVLTSYVTQPHTLHPPQANALEAEMQQWREHINHLRESRQMLVDWSMRQIFARDVDARRRKIGHKNTDKRDERLDGEGQKVLMQAVLGQASDDDPAGQGDGEDEAQAPGLTKGESTTLHTLALIDPAVLASTSYVTDTMAAKERLSETTTRKAIKKLVSLGLAERPEGERQGARLTIKGRRLSNKLA